MIITTYNPETFARKTTITHTKCVTYKKRFYDVGSFQIVLPEATKADIGDIIIIDDFQGRVREVQTKQGETIVVGYDLKSLFSQRVLSQDVTYTSKKIGYILTNMASTFLNIGSRKITGLSIVSSNVGETVTYTFSKGKRVSDELKTFCEKYNVGYDISFDENVLTFQVLFAEDRTSTYIGKYWHNVDELEKTKSNYDLANVIYYDKDDEVKTEGTASGINRYEGYASTDIKTYRQEHQETESITATPTDKTLQVGQIVTVVFENEATEKTITEIETTIEHSRKIISPVFGTEKENPIKKLFKG